MKKLFVLFGLLTISVLSFGQEVNDNGISIFYKFGDSLMDFLKSNGWTLGFALLYFISEWLGETGKVPEGSIWRKLINWGLELLRKKGTVSAKMKRFGSKSAGLARVLVIGIILSGLTLGAMAQEKKVRPYRWYPFKDKKTELRSDASTDMPIYSKDSTLYFAPAVSFDIYTRGMTTGKHSIGAIPGIGYNFIYNPYLWEKNYLAGFGMFASAHQDEDNPDIFTFEVTPVLSLLNWIKVGYGYQMNFGGQNEWVLRLGIVKSF